MRPALPCFSRSSVSVYYTERKPKNEERKQGLQEAWERGYMITTQVAKIQLSWLASKRRLIVSLTGSHSGGESEKQELERHA